MRYGPEHKEQTRQRIVQAAARRFRSRGTEGASVGDLMRDLHLTHGGFYRHFDSKERLVAEAFEHGLKQGRDRAARAIAKAPPGGELKAIIDTYLDLAHCDDVADGCPVAALASELARRPRGARTVFQRALREHVHLMEKYIPGATEDERRRKAIALFSGMAGTLTIARAFTEEHDRRKILEGARPFFLKAAQQ
jgi:TetR/AcrR family transcriptional regulator, transcriptional repressor for nem operon